ncbi:hypothetical protein RCH14_003777 [Massilia sp. MP_M2]|uniref:hypothetical protein n=1 Tax=Massilia sp. MP_M2 TaxID=3071713 RepID=UPI00319E0FE4
MTFSDDLLIAYINGDLAEPARAAVERATRADPVLAARVAQHRAELRSSHGRSVGVSANGHDGGPGPQRAAPSGAKVVHLNSLRPGRPMPMPLPQPAPSRVVGLHWVTLAAALLGSAVLGAVGWHHLGQSPGLAVLDHDNGVLVARGALVTALDDQLATPGPSDSGVRIGVTFVAKDGGYCRSFVVDTTAGLACLRRGRWTIPVLSQGTAGAAWLDGSIPPPAVRAAIEARIAGSALAPAAERAAQQRGWVR